MKHSLRELFHATLLGCLLAVFGAGCTTTQSTRAETLKPTTGADVDLSQYQIATVLSFEPIAGMEIDPSMGMVAATIAQAKGWKPPPEASNAD